MNHINHTILHKVTYHAAYGHAERIFDVQFNPLDSTLLASASEDMTLRMWRLQPHGNFKQVLCCYGHEAEVMRIAWTADGQFVATGSADRTVRIWQAPGPAYLESTSYNSQELAVLHGHPEEVYHVEFLDGTVPGAAGYKDGRQVKLAGGTRQTQQGTHNASPNKLAGHLLAASAESLFLWDLRSCTLLGQYDAPGTSCSTVPPEAAMEGYCHAYIYSCAYQPSQGPLLACACNDGVLRFWALRTSMDDQGRTATDLRYRSCKRLTHGGGHHSLVSAVFDSSGTRLAIAARDGRVLILGVCDLQQAYTADSSSSLPEEPKVYLLSCFQAHSKLLTMSNLPGYNYHEGQQQQKCAQQDKAEPNLELPEIPREGRERQKKFVEPEEGNSGKGEGCQTLLVALMDGRVIAYDWNNTDSEHHVLSHPIQEQQLQQQGSLPALFAVAASQQGDTIAAAGQASTLLGSGNMPPAVPAARAATVPKCSATGAAASNAAPERLAGQVKQGTEPQQTITLAPPPELLQVTSGLSQAKFNRPVAAAAATAATRNTARRRRARHSDMLPGHQQQLQHGGQSIVSSSTVPQAGGTVGKSSSQLPWGLQGGRNADGAILDQHLGVNHKLLPFALHAQHMPAEGARRESAASLEQDESLVLQGATGLKERLHTRPASSSSVSEALAKGGPGPTSRHMHASMLQTPQRAPVLVWRIRQAHESVGL